MKTSNIWRDCLIKALNVPEQWRNLDGQKCEPERQDVFWVYLTKSEVIDLSYFSIFIRDRQHVNRIIDSVAHHPGSDFCFIISRTADYIQYYPYLNLNSLGSLWEGFAETAFTTLSQLSYLERAA